MEPSTLTWVVIAALVLAVVLGVWLLVARRKAQKRAKEEAFHHMRCPGCKRRLRYQERQVGHKGRCSHCGREVVFPPTSLSVE